MMNPWFSFSVQVLRFGLEAQNTAFASFLRLAEGIQRYGPSGPLQKRIYLPTSSVRLLKSSLPKLRGCRRLRKFINEHAGKFGRVDDREIRGCELVLAFGPWA